MATVATTRPGWIARTAGRSGVYYGWLVVAVTLLASLVSQGVRQAPGIVIKPLEAEFGWDRAAISLAVALSLLLNGIAGPFSGWLMDRFGPRLVLLGGLSLSVLGGLALTTIGSLIELNFWYGVVIGMGTGVLSVVLGAAVANRWFVARRGLVVGILTGASSAGQLIFLPAMMALAVEYGWRYAILLPALVLGLVVLPLGFLIMKDGPNKVGLKPFGSESAPPATALEGRLTPMAAAVRTSDFWLLAGSFFVCGFTTFGLIGTHFIPHAIEHGFTPTEAAGTMALLGILNIFGTTLSGFLTDRWDPRRLLLAYYGFRAISLVFLPFVADMQGLTIFAIFYGLDWIATVPPTVALTADNFGRRSVGVIFGWIVFSHSLGGALASWIGGVARVWLGDYQLTFLAAALLAFGAAALCQFITAPSRAAAPARA